MANIQEDKVLLGRMDRENSFETMNLYDYIEAHNIRTVGNEESDGNYTTNLEGTRLITINLPVGQNKAIGSQRFETVSKAYFVRYNSMGYHQIIEFDYELSLETVIFENISQSNDTDILNWTADMYFSDIRLVHERFLILNNGVNEIYTIDLTRFRDPNNTTFVEDDLYLIKKQPLVPARVEYVNNVTKSTNNVRGNLFQFRYQYRYEDFRESAWGTVSKREVPINEQSNGQGQSVSISNAMIVTTFVNIDEVEELNIATRIGNGNWLLVKRVTKEHLMTLVNGPTRIPRNSTTGDLTDVAIMETYDEITGTYEFVFYNEGLYPVLDQVEVENPYDSVPKKAETVEVINGNLIAVGGITEGYDRPEIESVTINSSQYAPNLSNIISGGTDFDFSHTEEFNRSYARFHFKGEPKEGDVVYFKYRFTNTVVWTTMSYLVTAGNEASGLTNTLQSASQSFNMGGDLFNGAVGDYIQTKNPSFIYSQIEAEFYVVRKDIGILNTQSINILKSNSSYQLALAYADKFGRYFPIVTDDRFIVDTKAIAETQGNLSQINWTIQPEAPEGAVSYQWLLSENQKYQKSIYLTSKLDTAETSQNYIALEVKSLERFYNNEKDSQISYSFTKGDKVVLMYTTNGSNNQIVDWFRYPFIELDIVDFTVETDPVNVGDTKYILKVRRTDLLNREGALTWLEGKDIMLEIYTPKKRDIDTENILFYEIGEQYPIVDGQHSVVSGSIREGDWYYKGRLYESTVSDNVAIAYEVEDPNFSDNYESNFWSAGRARTYNDEKSEVEKKASIRYSDEYVYGNTYNGISRFYLERIYGEQGGESTSKYGWIRKLESRDNALVCIQEFKVGIIPVHKSIIYDNTDKSLVADSGRIFGSIQYRIGNYGCGTAKQSIAISRDSNIYFFDDNNCVPVRDSYQALDVIDVNMSSYFIKHAKIAKSKGAKFIGYVDELANEYNLTIEEVSGRLTTINFETDSIEYKDLFVPQYSDISINQPDNGGVTIGTGYVATYTPNQDYVGRDDFSVAYTDTLGNNFTKNIELNVVLGDSTPDPFNFNSKSNQQLGVPIVSNAIIVSGINMPIPISVVNGEYSINGGPSTSVAGEVVAGDSIVVSHITAETYETTVTTTLNINGVTGDFVSTTTEAGVTEYVYVDSTIKRLVNGNVAVELNVSEALSVDYQISGFIEYRQYGSPQVTPDKVFSIPAGDLSVELGMGIKWNTGDFSVNYGLLIEISSSLRNNDPVLCADNVVRLLSINFNMQEEA